MSFLKVARRVAWTLVAVVTLAMAGVTLGWIKTEWARSGQPTAATTVGRADIGGSFSLVNHRGQRVTDATFRGKPTAYFFGFTHCPEVCPTTLIEMTQRLQELGPDADRLNVVFVTVDPERDTPEHLAGYLQSFDSRIVGLTGTLEEVATVAEAFKISYRKVPTEGGYTMDHTASVVVTNDKGTLVALIDYHEDAPIALAKLRRALKSGNAN